MKKININLSAKKYSILVERNGLEKLDQYIEEIQFPKKFAIITTVNVADLFLKKITDKLKPRGYEILVIMHPEGEKNKTLMAAAKVCERLLEHGFDRFCGLINLGGGMTSDIGGFAAGLYMRGIRYINVPTTLLAQTDSAIGGKTGVNLRDAKNLLGVFYHPDMVLCDPDILVSLSDIEFISGMAEVIKYAILGDSHLFDYLDNNKEQILQKDPKHLRYIVERCARIKAELVSEDEYDFGKRRLLNLGHTFGHAVEALTSYDRFRHGHAVAIGISIASNIANKLGILKKEDYKKIEDLLDSYRLPTATQNIDPEAAFEQLIKDKKVKLGRLHLVLPTAIGEAVVKDDVPADTIKSAISETFIVL